MKMIKLSALPIMLASTLFAFTSCEKEESQIEFSANDLPVTAAQTAPAVPSPGTGKMSVYYNKGIKVLNYTVNWSGLTDSVIALRICGPADPGYYSINPAFTGANPTAFTTTPHLVIQEFTGSAPRALQPGTGTFTGTLSIDGVRVKEEDLLNNRLYFTIHTKTIIPPPAPAPANLTYRWFGELRGQIKINN